MHRPLETSHVFEHISIDEIDDGVAGFLVGCLLAWLVGRSWCWLVGWCGGCGSFQVYLGRLKKIAPNKSKNGVKYKVVRNKQNAAHPKEKQKEIRNLETGFCPRGPGPKP